MKSHPFFKSVDWALLRWEKPPLSPKVVKHTAAVDDDAMFDMDEEQQDGGFGGQGVN